MRRIFSGDMPHGGPLEDVSGHTYQRLGAATTLHNVLHGFRSVRGMGTTSLEANLLQNMTSMREEIIYKVFLKLKKAYSALDRDKCL